MADDIETPLEVVPINRSAGKEQDGWSKFERLSRILSIALIPIVLAAVGWLVQHQIQTQTAVVQQQLQNQAVGKDYVQLAVSILKEPDQSRVRPELRAWAVDLLNAYSSVKLKDDLAAQLRNGQSVLPPFETFTPIPSSALSTELNNALQPALQSFQQYLSKAGFQIEESGQVKYRIVRGDEIKTESGEFYSLYDPHNKVLMVASTHLHDFDLIRREYMRHVLDPNYPGFRDPSQDERWLDYYAVGNGLATYFSCSFSNSAIFAASDKDLEVNLENSGRFKRRPRNPQAAHAIGEEVWAGAFWELRKKIGQPFVDQLLATAWQSWQPLNSGDDLFVTFVSTLIEADKSRTGGQHGSTIQDIFKNRGLKM